MLFCNEFVNRLRVLLAHQRTYSKQLCANEIPQVYTFFNGCQ